MANQASFNVTAGNDITEAWGDAVGAHLVTTETATPATVHEGKLWVRTDEDRLYARNGSAANVRVGWYSATGRTGGRWDDPTTSPSVANKVALSGTAYNVRWLTPISDSDAMMTFGGSNPDTAIIPVDGLWAITFQILWSTTWASAGDWVRITAGGVLYDAPMSTATGVGAISVMVPLSAGAGVACSVIQASGSNKTMTSANFAVFRIGP